MPGGVKCSEKYKPRRNREGRIWTPARHWVSPGWECEEDVREQCGAYLGRAYPWRCRSKCQGPWGWCLPIIWEELKGSWWMSELEESREFQRQQKERRSWWWWKAAPKSLDLVLKHFGFYLSEMSSLQCYGANRLTGKQGWNGEASPVRGHCYHPGKQ